MKGICLSSESTFSSLLLVTPELFPIASWDASAPKISSAVENALDLGIYFRTLHT